MISSFLYASLHPGFPLLRYSLKKKQKMPPLIDTLPEEMVGLEHILVPERIMVLLNELKRNHRLWVLANLNHPERLRPMIANASNVASHIAQCKAKNVADYRSY